MKTLKVIVFALIAVVSLSTTQAVAGWFGGDNLFPEAAIEVGIRKAVFQITKDYSDWGKTTDVVDIEIHQKYRTNQKKLAKLKQLYYKKGVEVPKGVRRVFSNIGLYKSNDDFQEELLSVAFTANFIAEGKKHEIVANFLFTKYPQEDSIRYLNWVVFAWTDKNPEQVDDTNYDEFRENAKESINIFEEIIVIK
ncbi:MAG: hypothetical protein ACKUBY_02480 [Candidatus Moraniibacteriota bacterium]|jgi:hypothetical protein